MDISMPTLTCPRCNTAREPKDFKRIATLAQTRSWLKNPLATKRIVYSGSTCNDCHKQTTRKRSDLTPEEYRKRLVNEGKDPDEVDQLYESRVKLGKAKLRRGAIKTLKITRQPLFVPVIATLNKLIQALKNRIKYIQQTETDPEALAKATHFLQICLAQAVHSRDKILMKKKTASVPPARWQELLSPRDHEDRTNAHNLMPERYQNRFWRLANEFNTTSSNH